MVVVVALFGTRAGLLLRVLFFLTQRGLLDSSACLKELPLSAWKAGDGVTLSSSFFLVFFFEGGVEGGALSSSVGVGTVACCV